MITIWIVGRLDRSDSGLLLAEISRLASNAIFMHFARPSAACEAAQASSADMILVLQHHPYEFSAGEADALIGTQPLASVTVGVGAWCASSMRSHAIWPESVVVPFHSLLSRFEQEFDRFAHGYHVLPVTAGRDEAVLFETRDVGLPLSGQTVVVSSPDAALAGCLKEDLHLFGGTLSPRGAAATSELAVIDLDPFGRDTLDRLASLRNRDRHLRIIGLTAVPTHDIVDRAKRHGVDAVLSKPYRIEDLLRTISPWSPRSKANRAARSAA